MVSEYTHYLGINNRDRDALLVVKRVFEKYPYESFAFLSDIDESLIKKFNFPLRYILSKEEIEVNIDTPLIKEITFYPLIEVNNANNGGIYIVFNLEKTYIDIVK